MNNDESQEKEEIKRLLKTVADHFKKEDNTTRERQLRKMRMLKLYWNNFSMIYWSEVSQDYRLANRDTFASNINDQDYYDKPVNVFRAFLETIIAALSIQIPSISCVPDDADNPNDIATAKVGNKISELIYKHNDAIFIWLQALYIYCTEGMIATYVYTREDKKYGTYKQPKYEEVEEQAYVCPNCKQRIPDEIMSNELLNEFDPDDEDVNLHSEITNEGAVCPECAAILDPELQKTLLIVQKLVGETTHPKSRVCIETYGGLYVKVANYAKKQEDTPYLTYSFETHYSNMMEAYSDLRKSKNKIERGGGSYDLYEQAARTNPQYRGETPEENVTVDYTWLRCAAFNILEDDNYKKLKKKFPDGVKVCQVNGIVTEYVNESLDDHWTLSKNPLSDHLTHDPLGELLINIQDIINDLISLTLQTIEHGIAQTFADPAVVDFNNQNQIEAMPGTLTPTKQQGGTRNVGESFYTVKQASLSPEVFNFYRIIEELGQFVSGALPSVFGGQMGAGSSRTAQEYQTSKSSALQRLQTPWKMLTILWKGTMGKSIPMYIKEVKEDERHVEKDKQGNFVNTYIRREELVGKIGDIELEPSDKMPISDDEIADMVMQLMQLNNQQITSAMMDPENLPYFRKVVKMPQFKLPGEDERTKQYEEIALLVNETAVVQQPTTEQIQQAQATLTPLEPIEKSSLPVDPDVDNHGIEASICRTWLVSDAGRLAKVENPEGYKNVLLHMKEHLAVVQQQMMGQVMPQVQAQAQAKMTAASQPQIPSENGTGNGSVKSENGASNGGTVQ